MTLAHFILAVALLGLAICVGGLVLLARFDLRRLRQIRNRLGD